MDASSRRSRLSLRVVADKPPATAPISDELKIARHRMRHLAPWKVKPVPAVQSHREKPSEPADADTLERNRQLALKVLAVHMAQAGTKGGLR